MTDVFMDYDVKPFINSILDSKDKILVSVELIGQDSTSRPAYQVSWENAPRSPHLLNDVLEAQV